MVLFDKRTTYVKKVKNHWVRLWVDNLFLVAGQKQTLPGIAGRANLPPTIAVSLLFMMLLNLGSYGI